MPLGAIFLDAACARQPALLPAGVGPAFPQRCVSVYASGVSLRVAWPASSTKHLTCLSCMYLCCTHDTCCVQAEGSRSVSPALARQPPSAMPWLDSEPAGGAADLHDRHFLSLKDFTASEVQQLLRTAAALKKWYRGQPAGAASAFVPLAGESIGMIFQKRSTRTRVSTELGMQTLGGHALFLGSDDIQLGENESLPDTARVLSRFNSVLLARVYEHEDVEALAANSSVPVINALRSV